MDPSPFWARSGQEWICTLFRHGYPKAIPLLEIPPWIYDVECVLLCTLPHDCVLPVHYFKYVYYLVHYLRNVCYPCITSRMYVTQSAQMCVTCVLLQGCILLSALPQKCVLHLAVPHNVCYLCATSMIIDYIVLPQ